MKGDVMKKKLLVVLAIAFLMFGMVGMAQAIIIVDTGSSLSGQSWTLNQSQWLASEFSISQAYTITDLEGYLLGYINSFGGRTLTAAIYAGGNDRPAGTALFSNQFSVGEQDGWYGALNQSWFLQAGTYWAAFEVRQGDTYDGSLPGSAINPLGNEAFTSLGKWYPNNSLSLAIRISGDASSNQVPEPTTLLLLGLGLVGLAGVRRKFQKQTRLEEFIKPFIG
jgi:hypothetical protein